MSIRIETLNLAGLRLEPWTNCESKFVVSSSKGRVLSLSAELLFCSLSHYRCKGILGNRDRPWHSCYRIEPGTHLHTQMCKQDHFFGFRRWKAAT